MSWDIILFNSKEKIQSVENLDDSQLVDTNFDEILESSFNTIVVDENHREIKGIDFSIDFFIDEEPVSNKMISVYGENGLYEIIELAKKHNWQIYDTGLDGMVDLEHPEKNGYANHKQYVQQIMKNKNGA